MKPCQFCGCTDGNVRVKRVKTILGKTVWEGRVHCKRCGALGPPVVGQDRDYVSREAHKVWEMRVE